MPDAREYTVGSSSLVLGADSYTNPTDLGDTEYVMGMNVACRGGIVQTRPGTRTLFCVPDGNFQGAKLFTPQNGISNLVFAVDGVVYVSPFPFVSYRRLRNVQFSATAKYMAWAVCLKSTDFTPTGDFYSLPNPYSVLVMQDGYTRAAYWDGGNSGHLNPASDPDVTDVVTPGFDETPVGLWMIWSGNRLWVSRGNQIFASDIGNPLKFTESLYLNEGRAFYLSGPCTGMIETADRQGIIAFTENDGTFLHSANQDRPSWLDENEFQRVIVPNVGCVAPRSLVTQYGLTWWFGPRGLTNFDAALRVNLTSRLDYKDNEMFSSKAYIGPDLSGVCGSYYENYLLMSVPSADVYNRHTWALDQAPFEGNASAWAGIWTGWRPIEWTRGIVNGSERIFFASVDYDGKNRIWEAMLEEKADNGCPITCYLQTREHTGGDLSPKRYQWTKFFLSQIYGRVDLNCYVGATKGAFQLQHSYALEATRGQIYADTSYSELGPLMVGNRVQTRIIRTPYSEENDACNMCGVESEEGNKIDYAFSHLLVWSGQMGIRAYQGHMLEKPDRDAGECTPPETGPRVLNSGGCSGLELFVDGQVFEPFTAVRDGVAKTSYGTAIWIKKEAVSYLSQENADALAECAVEKIINQLEGTSIRPGVYETVAAEIGGQSTYVIVDGTLNPPAPGGCIVGITGCACRLQVPPFGEPYSTEEEAQTQIDDFTSNCIGWIDASGCTVESFLASLVSNILLLNAVTSVTAPPGVPRAGMAISLNLKAGSTLTVAYSVAVTRGGEAIGITADVSLQKCNGDPVFEDSFTDEDDHISGSVDIPITEDGEYILNVGGQGDIGDIDGTFENTITCDQPMTANPVVAVWNDGTDHIISCS